jgi:hypothetical protein
VVVAAVVLGRAAAPAGAVPAVQVTYQLPAVQGTPIFFCGDVGCTNQLIGYDFLGSGSALNCLPPGPCDGTFDLSFSPARFFPPNPCQMKQGTGSVNVTWADATTSIGTFSFKARDSKTMSITGSMTGGTNLAFAGAAVGGLVGLPPNPCVGGSASSTMTIG